jgi:hypothetical protein
MSVTDYTTTPNLGLLKPIFNKDTGNWGAHWNQNADTLDNVLPLSGGTLSGALGLPNGALAAPSLKFGAADGTGLNRSANTLSISIQGTMSASFFAGSMQSYGQLYMLGNKIVQVADATAAADALNMRTGDARYAPITLAAEIAALRAEVQALKGRTP